MKDEILIREFTRIFRCTPEMAPTYLKRVHERMGYEVPLESIVAALHQISPKRLTMDALIERLRKMERTPGRARKPAPSQGRLVAYSRRSAHRPSTPLRIAAFRDRRPFEAQSLP